jgi:3-hydroxyacyl-CoA dehydrogenase/enoyl-CoA hydratase/3-hydroxybutyryl-CoA epimerase/3-hydroxyacyl-CoA dehydrogenase/enoyl-CoA hydratase/3-hydroxybutyryl-CoA epimerase/enoyl-CoA isomerase
MSQPSSGGPPVRSVGIVGAGLMGTAIAAAGVKNRLSVVIGDADAATLATAPERIACELAQQDATDASAAVAERLRATNDLAAVGACNLVIESVVEDLAVKRQLYTQLKPHVGPETILASNTSTIPIARLAEAVDAPERFCGVHFFHPVRHRPLVEIIRGPKTSEPTVAAAVAFARTIRKLPIVIDDGPGFLVNRLLVPYLNEALEMLLEGAAIEQIEHVATGFGMAMGPLRLLDEIGIDTTFLAGRVLWEAFPDRVVASPLLVTMLKKKRLGRKVGAGFFRYSVQASWDDPGEADPTVEEIVEKWRRDTKQFSDSLILDRLLLSMILEASRLLEERRVSDPRDIDVAMLLGLGFPADRGGLLYWADTIGPQEILRRLEPLAPLGPRMTPPLLLCHLAQRGARFYD